MRRKGSGRHRLVLSSFIAVLALGLVTIRYSTVLSTTASAQRGYDPVAVHPNTFETPRLLNNTNTNKANANTNATRQIPTRISNETATTTISDEKKNRVKDQSPPKAAVTAPLTKHQLQEPNASRPVPSAQSIPRPTNIVKSNITIAYAISLVKCGDRQSTEAGLIDASVVMRHSIHLTHQQSKYNYKMYAIVHKNAEGCSKALKDSGFEIVVVDQPIQKSEIRGEFLRKNIQKEWCCGHQEFIKLYAYSLPQPIIVHVDIDFAFYQPIDHLFDAILYDKDSPEGKEARSYIALERAEEEFPDKIDGFITRDWPQAIPGRKALYQAGFLVARRDPSIIEDALNVVREGNYVDSFSSENGWGGKGYGAFVGAMAMQGLMAYFYDIIRPNTMVELNHCRYNHMGMDTRYRAHPNFMPKSKKVGKCRNLRDYCEDCRTTDVKEIFNVHYTQCRKPWNCIGEGWPNGRKKLPADTIDTNSGNYLHCMELISKWHQVRADLESKLFNLTGDDFVQKGREGEYKPEYFHGHCRADGGKHYLPLNGTKETFLKIPELYQDSNS